MPQWSNFLLLASPLKSFTASQLVGCCETLNIHIIPRSKKAWAESPASPIRRYVSGQLYMFKLEFPSLSSFTCMHNHVYLSQLLEELEQLSIAPSLPENLVHCFSPPVPFLPPLLIINTTCFLTIPVTMLIPYRHNQRWDVKSFFFFTFCLAGCPIWAR